jgi:hypothetical protein
MTDRSTAWIAGLVISFSASVVSADPADEASSLDWPQFRGPGGSARSQDKAPVAWGPDKNMLWKEKLPGPGSSSPVILGDRVFLTCHTGYGLDAQSGEEMERLRLHVLCLHRDTGKVLWQKEVQPELPEEPYEKRMFNHGYASSTPAADRERVYVFFGRSGVLAFDHEGKQLWRASVGSKTHGWGSGASPVLHGGLVIVNASVESESIVAFDRKTGKEAWRAPGIREAWNTPLLVDVAGGSRELVVGMVERILGLDPGTGKELWRCEGIRYYMCPSAVAHDGVLYISGGRERTTMAIRAGGRGDVTKTHLLWKVKKGSNVSSPIIHDGHLYLANDAGAIALCLDAKTGETRHEERLPRIGEVFASPVLADGKIYYTGRHGGETVVVAAKPEFEVLATNALGEKSRSNASPAIAGGRIFIRTDDSVYCLGTK